MAPPGLVVSKLGVQASAGTDTVRGLLCLKVSLPKEGEAKQVSRWGLFAASPPKLLSQPSLHPLPLPNSVLRSPSPHVRTAAALLSLSPAQASSLPAGLSKPYIDVSSTTGQVYVVLDPAVYARRKSIGLANGNGYSSPQSLAGERREWLLIMEFEVAIERIESFSKVSLPVPRCLDNVLRFQITSPHASSSSYSSAGEVSIVTEPKVLPLPPSAFASHLLAKGVGTGRIAGEDGWEDGEVHGPNSDSEDGDGDGDDDDDAGSWLEGRFQSADVFRLEWSFANSLVMPTISISPTYDPVHPSIDVNIDAALSSSSVELVIPDGWGWSSLTINAHDLESWCCVDPDWWAPRLVAMRQSAIDIDNDPDATVDGDVEDIDDSFSAVRARRNPSTHPQSRSHAGLSLLRQTLPADMKVEDFSFELYGLAFDPKEGTMPRTPVSTMKVPPSHAQKHVASLVVDLPEPLPGRLFELECSGVEMDKQVAVRGTLVPLSRLTLVSPAVPVPIPFIRVEGAQQCEVICPGAEEETIRDASGTSVGVFSWTDKRGKSIPTAAAGLVKGDVRVRVEKAWGHDTLHVRFPWPRRAGEMAFEIPRGATYVRVARAQLRGATLPRAVIPQGEGVRVQLKGSGDGVAEVVLEIGETEDGMMALPRFEGAVGTMTVELVGKGWGDTSKWKSFGTLKSSSPPIWTFDLASSKPPMLEVVRESRLSPLAKIRARTLLSWSTLLNLFFLWLLLSMGQQVQRLRNEVAFVAEEARDLRLYALAQHPDSGRSTSPSQNVDNAASSGITRRSGADSQEQNDGQDPRITIAPDGSVFPEQKRGHGSMELGRVVFGRTTWDWDWKKWARHPTVQTLSHGVRWFWRTVVWLVVPP